MRSILATGGMLLVRLAGARSAPKAITRHPMLLRRFWRGLGDLMRLLYREPPST